MTPRFYLVETHGGAVSPPVPSLVRVPRNQVPGIKPWLLVDSGSTFICAYTANVAAMHYRMWKRRMERGEAA